MKKRYLSHGVILSINSPTVLRWMMVLHLVGPSALIALTQSMVKQWLQSISADFNHGKFKRLFNLCIRTSSRSKRHLL